MAMLAEPRRKQKLSHDPRNRMWSDDQSKFGQRMLEKMGWQSGKGLGANEDGSTQHIKVSVKNNTLGVGCTPSHEDNWIAHQDDFNDILATLNQDHSKEDSDEGKTTKIEDSSSKSLEARSKKSRSRVHYKKFTRGKDLSRYGTTDINCILGVRGNRSTPSTPRTQSANNSDNDNSERENPEEDEKDEKEDASHGITTIVQNTSIQDYFAKKMAELKRARQSPKQATKDSENDEGSIEVPSQNNDDDLEEKKAKKSKKKKKNKRKDASNGILNDNVTEGMTVESVGGEKLEKSSKRNQDLDNFDRTVDNVDNEQPKRKKCKKNGDDELDQIHIEGDHVSSTSSKKSKKKKKRKSIE